MLTLQQIAEIAGVLLTRNPDPVPGYRLLRDVFRKSPSDPVLIEARRKMLQSHWIKILADEQKEDGSWGRFHSEDTKIKTTFRTTEEAIQRGLALGLEASDPVFAKVVCYMENVLRGKAQWSDWPEKNERWPMGVRLITAGTLATIEPTNQLVNAEREFWLKVAQAAFESGTYILQGEQEAFKELLGIHVPNSFLITKYALNILAVQSHRLPGDLNEQLLRWAWATDAIRYTCVSLHNPKPQHLNYWLNGVELLAGFPNWQQHAEHAVEWIVSQQNPHGFWDFPDVVKTEYFPLSESWRKKGNREIDYSVRILTILSKFTDYPYSDDSQARWKHARSVGETQ